MVTVLAPGINVYSMDIDKSKNYYETLKDYSEPFLTLGSIVGGNPEEGYHSVIDVHIRKLREKLGDDYIRTIKGVGYTFKEK